MLDRVETGVENLINLSLTPEAIELLEDVKDTIRTLRLSDGELAAAHGKISDFAATVNGLQDAAAGGAYRDTAYQDRYQDTPYRDTSTYNDTPSYRDAPKDP